MNNEWEKESVSKQIIDLGVEVNSWQDGDVYMRTYTFNDAQLSALLDTQKEELVKEIRNHATYKSVGALFNQGYTFAIAGDELEKLLKSLTQNQ